LGEKEKKKMGKKERVCQNERQKKRDRKKGRDGIESMRERGTIGIRLSGRHDE